MSDDLKAAAAAKGQTAAFNRANTFWNRGADKIDKVIRPAHGASGDKAAAARAAHPDQVYNHLFSKARTSESLIRKTMRSLRPKERDLFASRVLHDLGRARPNEQNAVGDVFSVETFMTNWNRMTPAARQAIFRGQHAKDLNKIVEAGEILKDAIRAGANPSGTTGQFFAGMSAYGAGEILLAPFFGFNVGGGPGFLIGASAAGAAVQGASKLSGAAIAKLLSSRRFVNWLASAVTNRDSIRIANAVQRLHAMSAKGNDAGAIREYLNKISEPVE